MMKVLSYFSCLTNSRCGDFIKQGWVVDAGRGVTPYAEREALQGLNSHFPS